MGGWWRPQRELHPGVFPAPAWPAGIPEAPAGAVLPQVVGRPLRARLSVLLGTLWRGSRTCGESSASPGLSAPSGWALLQVGGSQEENVPGSGLLPLQTALLLWEARSLLPTAAVKVQQEVQVLSPLSLSGSGEARLDPSLPVTGLSQNCAGAREQGACRAAGSPGKPSQERSLERPFPGGHSEAAPSSPSRGTAALAPAQAGAAAQTARPSEKPVDAGWAQSAGFWVPEMWK